MWIQYWENSFVLPVQVPQKRIRAGFAVEPNSMASLPHTIAVIVVLSENPVFHVSCAYVHTDWSRGVVGSLMPLQISQLGGDPKKSRSYDYVRLEDSLHVCTVMVTDVYLAQL